MTGTGVRDTTQKSKGESGTNPNKNGKQNSRENKAEVTSLIEETGELTYMGEGEWGHIDRRDPVHSPPQLQTESKEAIKWIRQLDPDVELHYQVLEKGYPNRFGAQIPVYSKRNLERLAELLRDYSDKEVVEWIRYGWPTGRVPGLKDPIPWGKNHKGAEDHPQALQEYISKETKHQAVMGPYTKIPFKDKVGISPLSTRPKKESEDRRVILDLSFPIGEGVNDGIPKDSYMGFEAKLTFPRTDDFAFRIFQLGKDCLMFKVDLSRYFRQLPLDPGDYSLIGYTIDGKIYFDKVLPMDMRSAPYVAQRVTNAIAYIHRQMGFFLLNYVDDFVSAEVKSRIWQGYRHLTKLLQELGVDTSKEKLVEPTTRMEFLGITFDSRELIMEIPKAKIEEIITELDTWLYKTSASRKEIESLVGKLQFAAKCVRMGRTFIVRLINWIRGLNRHEQHRIPLEARKDITWWRRFLQEYNGVSLMWLVKHPEPDTIVATDACKEGYGGIAGKEYFRGKFPREYRDMNIATLELKAVMVALKHWGSIMAGKYFWIHVDNQAVAIILNTGSSRDQMRQDTLREIALIAATHQFVIRAKQISGVSNRIPDWLSRWHQQEARKQFRAYAQDKSLKKLKNPSSLLKHIHNW